MFTITTTKQVCLIAALIAVASSFRSYSAIVRPSNSWVGNSYRNYNHHSYSKGTTLLQSVLDDIADEEELESFQRISKNYLTSKFQECVDDNCVSMRNKDDLERVIRDILPPMSKEKLETEIVTILSSFDTDSVTINDFVSGFISNNYWKEAGFFVVKELIFLDCLHNYYFQSRSLLPNDEYDELKNQLAWEGSAAASLTG